MKNLIEEILHHWKFARKPLAFHIVGKKKRMKDNISIFLCQNSTEEKVKYCKVMNGNLILIYVEAAYRWIINFSHKIVMGWPLWKAQSQTNIVCARK